MLDDNNGKEKTMVYLKNTKDNAWKIWRTMSIVQDAAAACLQNLTKINASARLWNKRQNKNCALDAHFCQKY